MKVLCIKDFPSESEIARLGPAFSRNQEFPIDPGDEYVVLQLSFHEDSVWGRGGVVLVHNPDLPLPVFAPLCLFDVIDKSISPRWTIETWPGTISFAPAPFFAEHFMEDLADQVPEAVEQFKRALRELCEDDQDPALRST